MVFFKKKKEVPIRHKWCSIHFRKQDIADACGITIRTLQRICKKDKIDLINLTLIELVNFINEKRKMKSRNSGLE